MKTHAHIMDRQKLANLKELWKDSWSGDLKDLVKTTEKLFMVKEAAAATLPNLLTCTTDKGQRICHKSCYVCNLKEALAEFRRTGK